MKDFIRRFWLWIISSATDQLPDKVHLRDSIKQMYGVLDNKADAVSFAMSQADQAYEELRAEVVNYESLGREAERFLLEKKEEAAKRCVALQLQSKEKLEKMKSRYDALQRSAESAVVDFRRERQDVESRADQLPELEREEQVVRAQEQIIKKERLFSLDSPRASFDRVVQELNIRRAQLQNREILLAGPNAKLDLQIKEAIEERKVDEALDSLRQRISSKVLEVEVVEENTINSAQKLLEAPRYQGLLDFDSHEREYVLRKERR